MYIFYIFFDIYKSIVKSLAKHQQKTPEPFPALYCCNGCTAAPLTGFGVLHFTAAMACTAAPLTGFGVAEALLPRDKLIKGPLELYVEVLLLIQALSVMLQ